MTRRIHSFVWSGLAFLAFLIYGIVKYTNSQDITDIIACAIIGLAAFTFISCLILANNFIGDMVGEIFSWGFVRMPGLITTLDLDGLIWLLTVKLLFWILGFVLAILCGILAVVLGSVVSIFVYPFAIYKSFKEDSKPKIDTPADTSATV